MQAVPESNPRPIPPENPKPLKAHRSIAPPPVGLARASLARTFLVCALLVCALLASSLLSGCQPKAEEPVAPMPDVTNSAMNLKFLGEDMPEGFQVATNQGETLEFVPLEAERAGRMWVEVGPISEFGIDLVEVVNEQKADFEARPEGTFAGSREMLAHLGQCYYSRGTFDDEGTSVEEVRMFAIHPAENRLITLFYRYPDQGQEETKVRIPQLMSLLGSVEAPGMEAPVPPE